MTADSIIIGNIMTLDTDKPYVKAMVVVDGIIKYLGSTEIAMSFKGDKTKILNYGDATIYPGFMDAHTHGPMAGFRIFSGHYRCRRSFPGYVSRYS